MLEGGASLDLPPPRGGLIIGNEGATIVFVFLACFIQLGVAGTAYPVLLPAVNDLLLLGFGLAEDDDDDVRMDVGRAEAGDRPAELVTAAFTEFVFFPIV